eukprot:scaffold48259_cov27-Phaeocystis_antarctica.AAC.1
MESCRGFAHRRRARAEPLAVGPRVVAVARALAVGADAVAVAVVRARLGLRAAGTVPPRHALAHLHGEGERG